MTAFAPFVRRYVKYLHDKGRVRKQDDTLFAIQQRITDLPEEYLSWMKIDLKGFGEEVIVFIKKMIDHDHTDATALIEHYTEMKTDIEEWISLILVYNTEDITPTQSSILDRYQRTAVEYLNAIKQLKDISLHYYTLQQKPTKFIQHYIEKFDEKLLDLTGVIEYSFDGRVKSSLQSKVDVMARELELDDVRFMSDIRTSIVTHSDDKDNNHSWSQLIKINRSIILSGETILKSISYYTDIIPPKI